MKNLHSNYPWGHYALEVFGEHNYLELQSGIKIINATITNNTFASHLIDCRALVDLDIYNSIIYGNSPNSLVFNAEPLSYCGFSNISNNLFEQSQAELLGDDYVFWGFNLTNNIYSGKPHFIGHGLHPEMLSDNSPAINQGTLQIPDFTWDPYYDWFLELMDLPPYEFPEYDLAGNPRVVNGQISMGAYEFTDDVSDKDTVGNGFIRSALLGNYPNPFNPSTVITFIVGADLRVSPNPIGQTHRSAPTGGGAVKVQINIYNIKGQKVRGLVNGVYGAGEHSVVWNGKDDRGVSVGSGVYFYKMRAGEYESVKRMVLLK
jgi:hypothetical protein